MGGMVAGLCKLHAVIHGCCTHFRVLTLWGRYLGWRLKAYPRLLCCTPLAWPEEGGGVAGTMVVTRGPIRNEIPFSARENGRRGYSLGGVGG